MDIIFIVMSTIAAVGWPTYLGLLHLPSYGVHPKAFSARRHAVILLILIPCAFVFICMIYLKETT